MGLNQNFYIMKKIISAVIFSVLLVSCNNSQGENNTQKSQTKQMENQKLIGRKATLTYPELKAEVHYISENKIHWKTTDPEGNVAEETNELTYKKIGENLYFLNWVENDATTVSQIIDLEKNSVSAYLSYDEDGKRNALLLEGTFELH